MKATMPYALRQLLWMLKSAFQLMYLMSTGIVWVQQMIRLYIFAGCVWIFFVPHWWWYLTSANIIRHVSYRSSQTTKRRNLLRVLETEGVADVTELLRREQRLQRQQQIRAAAGRLGGATRRRPPPLGTTGAPSSLQGGGAGGGSTLSPTSAVGPYTVSSPATGRRLPPPRRPPRTSGRSAAGGGTSANAPVPPLPSSPSPPPQPTPAVSPDIRAFDKLIRESDRFSNVNPADGSILRSLPRHPPSLPPQPQRPLRHVGVAPAATASAAREKAAPAPTRSDRPEGSVEGPYREGRVRVAAAEDGGSSAAAALCDDPRFHTFLQQNFPPRGVDSGTEDDREGRPRGEAAVGPHLSTPSPAAPTRRPPQPLLGAPPSADRSGASASDWVDVDDEDEEDRLNLHNRATVDIVLPVPLDSLMKSMDYAKRSAKLRRKKFPIVINVSGGAWIIGSHLWSTMLSRVLAARGYVVFCPDYRNFPQTTMEGMTLDVSDAIAWVLNNAERYNGDLNDVTLMGQSAGAHLTMMSLISQAHLCAYEAARVLLQDGMGVPPPSDAAYNVPRYNPRKSIRTYVGLSGIYNLERLVPHLHRRGLNAPVLNKIAGGKDQLARYSVHAYFDRRRGGETGEVLPDNVFDFLPQRMYFLHGDADMTAPVTESASLVGVLRQAQMEFTLRRLTRNEESRRHAYRSRGLVPGALASPDELGPVSFADVPREEEGGEDEGQPEYRGGGHADAPDGARRHQQLALTPIVPPSRCDLPLTAVDLEFILIPDATHTDPIIEECIVGHRSCCADFICDYLTDGTQGTWAAAASPVLPVNLSGGGPDSASVGASSSTPATSFPAGSLRDSSADAENDYVRQNVEKVARWSRAVEFCVPPDGILPMAVPPEDRPRLLNWVTFFCPF